MLRHWLIVVALVVFAASSLAQDGNADLERALDPWSDPIPDRIALVISACERRLVESPGDDETRVMAARFQIAGERWDGAMSTARGAFSAAAPIASRARALYLIAFSEQSNARIRSATAAERERVNSESNAEMVRLSRELIPRPDDSSMARLLAEETAAVSSAALLNELGQELPLPELKALQGRVVVVDVFHWGDEAYVQVHLKTLESTATRGDAAALVRLVGGSNEELERLRLVTGASVDVEAIAWGSALARRVRTFPRRYVLDRRGKVRVVNPWGLALRPAVATVASR